MSASRIDVRCPDLDAVRNRRQLVVCLAVACAFVFLDYCRSLFGSTLTSLSIVDGLTIIAMTMKLGRLCVALTLSLLRVCCSSEMATSATGARLERRLRSRGWRLHDVCSWVAGVLMRLVLNLENARLRNSAITRPETLVCWCVGWWVCLLRVAADVGEPRTSR